MTKTLVKTLGVLTTLAGIFATIGSASAASLTYTSGTNFQPTDIEDLPISIQKFNSSLGTLTKVTLNFVGDLGGDAKFENRNNRPSTVSVNLKAKLSLNQQFLPAPLLEINPENVNSYNVSRFDGMTDFTGPSGRTLTTLAATSSGSKEFTEAQFLQVFTGNGNLDLVFSAEANSAVLGSGNITSEINTLAKANIQVIYEYDERKSVPESSAVLGIGLVAGFGLWSQRKQNRFKVSDS